VYLYVTELSCSGCDTREESSEQQNSKKKKRRKRRRAKHSPPGSLDAAPQLCEDEPAPLSKASASRKSKCKTPKQLAALEKALAGALCEVLSIAGLAFSCQCEKTVFQATFHAI
jgi:hypothetical protein